MDGFCLSGEFERFFLYLFIYYFYFMCVSLCVLSASSFYFSGNLQQGNGAIELVLVMWVLIPGWPDDTADKTYT